MNQAHLKIVRDATEVVRRHLGALPPSREREELYERLRDCAHETERWGILPARARDIDALMKRLLAVHVGVTRLEREASSADLRKTA